MATLATLHLVRFLHEFVNGTSSSTAPLQRSIDYLSRMQQEPEPLVFSKVAYQTLTVGWVAILLTGVTIGLLSLKMASSKRHFHIAMVVVQALALLGYSLTIGGYGLLPYEKSSAQHILIGMRDEFALHHVLPFFCLPPIVYVTNNMAGIFTSESLWIIVTLLLSTLYGVATLFLPKSWLGSFMALLSVVFALPYLVALLHTWPSSVKAAPKRVRKVLKIVCCLQTSVLLTLFVTFDLTMNNTISVDVENLILTICDFVLYGVTPLAIVGSIDALKDVYSREEYILHTKRASTIPTSAMTPHLPSRLHYSVE